MKKVIAFLCALVLVAATVGAIHMYAKQQVEKDSHTFGTWSNSEKFSSCTEIIENMNEHTLVTFGSSEFQHAQDTIYHPKNMFAHTDVEPMLIGAGYYQSLNHAITLAAIGNDIPNKKVVLFVSPTWFRKDGVPGLAYASNFSEMNYVGMLKNTNLSEDTKKYIEERTHELMQEDTGTLTRVERDERVLKERLTDNEKGSFLDDLQYKVYQSFLQEKSQIEVATQFRLENREQTDTQTVLNSDIDWNAYHASAVEEAQSQEQNDFYMSPKGYKRTKSKMKKKKDCLKDTDNLYSESSEYDDLRCFLDVCKELGVEPLVVELPVNGYWYDYMGADASTREKYYQNIRTITEEYGVQLADLSDQEFTPYFFEDGLHLAGEGWVTVDEILYNFAKQN